MPDHNSHPRRTFLATTLAGAPALLGQTKPKEPLGIGIIGVGLRGKRLLGWAQQAPGAEVRIMADLYDANLRKAQDLCMNRKVRLTKQWEQVIEDPSVQAVIIATPDFWHAPMVIAAAKAGKHIYCEKGWCLNLAEAKAMRKAVKESKVVMQLGHHYNSWPTYVRAKEIYKTGSLGKVTQVRSCYDGGGQYPHWKFYASDYETHTMPADATPEHIDWRRFVGNAPKRDFSAERFFTWRCYWDYGTGLAGDVMSHMWDATNMIMGLGIPEFVSAQGGLYMYKQERDVPDTWNTTFEYPAKDFAFTFSSTTANIYNFRYVQFLGHEKTLVVNDQYCRLYDAEWKPGYAERIKAAEIDAAKIGVQKLDATVRPEYSMKPDELKISSHMENLFDCIRTGEKPRCGVDRAFEEAVAICMSVEAYRRRRTVRWDARQEEIVDA
jgi:predicted dehydrogenase